jgi:SAM-dependent methyltransferase
MNSLTHADPVRVNVGCGSSPTPGWINLDNSLSVHLSRFPLLLSVLRRCGLANERQVAFARVAHSRGVRWANATSLPLAEGTVDVLYSSHMLEHLDCVRARAFLAEARRVLRPGGVLRLAVPDLWRMAEEYTLTHDADRFLERMRLVEPRASLGTRLRLLLAGPRNHQWMYDARSLIALVTAVGFADAHACVPGETTIAFPEPLDLSERQEESLYVEATR